MFLLEWGSLCPEQFLHRGKIGFQFPHFSDLRLKSRDLLFERRDPPRLLPKFACSLFQCLDGNAKYTVDICAAKRCITADYSDSIVTECFEPFLRHGTIMTLFIAFIAPTSET